MSDLIIVVVLLAMLGVAIAAITHGVNLRNECADKGGIYLESQCIKGEIIP